MKYAKALLCLLTVAALAGCGNSGSSSAESSEPTSDTSSEPSVDPSTDTEPVEVIAYDLTGMIDLYGMYTVNVDVKLVEGGTGYFTLTYTGADPFTWNDITWSEDSGAISANLHSVTAEGEVSDLPVTFYHVNSDVYGYVATNLGNCLVSNNSLSHLINAGGTISYFGVYSCTITADLISNGNAIYSISYTDGTGETPVTSSFSLPTTWGVDETTQATYLNSVNVSAEGEVTYVPVSLLLSYNADQTAITFANATVASNLGNITICSETAVVSMTGSVDLYGMYAAAVTVDLYTNGFEVYTIAYTDNTGESPVVSAASAVTAWGQKEDESYYISYFSIDAETGAATAVEAALTISDNVYSATVGTNLGNVELTGVAA